MNEEIAAFEISEDFFTDFKWEDSPNGYNLIDDRSTLFGVYPNHRLNPGTPCLLIDRNEKVFSAYYLAVGSSKPGLNNVNFIFGLSEPKAVFSVGYDDILAIHSMSGDQSINFPIFEEFLEAGLANLISINPINSMWRPWHGNLN